MALLAARAGGLRTFNHPVAHSATNNCLSGGELEHVAD
jgi:hypothetical protein